MTGALRVCSAGGVQLVGRVFAGDLEDDPAGHLDGMVVEFDRTQTIFTNPADERTEAYVTGRFG